MKVALMGTRGVPARYGGFETAAEEIGAGLAERGHDVVVYCREAAEHGVYRGMRRVHLPALRRRALETLSHGGISALHAAFRRPDAVIFCNAANAPWAAMLRALGIPVALHVDGHDGRRAKWTGVGARYYSVATRLGTKVANEVIVDSEVIKTEIDLNYGINSTFISYGAKRAELPTQAADARLAALSLRSNGYHLLVARFEPENQVCELIEGYVASSAALPLAVVGFAGYPGAYAASIRAAADADDRVRLLGPVWDQPLLDALYAGATSYLHGHSVGGTNPSLLRAMAQGTPVICYDCVYNRETTGGNALWFDDARAVGSLVERAERHGGAVQEIGMRAKRRAQRYYRWADTVAQYDELLGRLVGRTAAPTDRQFHVA
jgi:glycosyltransferase involved in cell wall biosynthesis